MGWWEVLQGPCEDAPWLAQMWTACPEERRTEVLVRAVTEQREDLLTALIAPDPTRVPGQAWAPMVHAYLELDTEDLVWSAQAALVRWLGPQMNLPTLAAIGLNMGSLEGPSHAKETPAEAPHIARQALQILAERCLERSADQAALIGCLQAKEVPAPGVLGPGDLTQVGLALQHIAVLCNRPGTAPFDDYLFIQAEAQQAASWCETYADRQRTLERKRDLADRPPTPRPSGRRRA